jgi:hypothetical protein
MLTVITLALVGITLSSTTLRFETEQDYRSWLAR